MMGGGSASEQEGGQTGDYTIIIFWREGGVKMLDEVLKYMMKVRREVEMTFTNIRI